MTPTSLREARAALVARHELRGRSLALALTAQTDEWFDELGAELPPGWSLAALGGYGRGLLCPGSDLDVWLLHPHRADESMVRETAERLWYPVWDAGLKLSPGVQSVRSALKLAGDELVTATALLSLRPLAGDEALVTELAAKAVAQWRKKPERWLSQLLETSQERWARYGEVSSLLEPNLKDGRGGLRDVDVLGWALATDLRDIDDAMEAPLDTLDDAIGTLIDARVELHRATGRPSDALLLQDQDAVASALGIDDADVLMAGVSAAARSIDWASERFWRRVDRLVNPPRWPGHRSRSIDAAVAGVVVQGDELYLTGALDLDEPAVVFEVAALAARNELALSREALTTLSDDTPIEPFTPWPEQLRQAFVSLLGAGAGMVPTIEALERYGLFSRYLPEWAHVRSLPQRNAFHTYNVDRHLLRTVANASELVRHVSRPDLLLVGALLHDIGKGYPRDHTEVGMELAAVIMPRMGFDATDTATVITLIEHHLLLPETATRRDLSDPRTISNVAEALGSVETLELLRALTEADSLATGPAAWSRWKATLMDRLTREVIAALEGAAPSAAPDPDERFAGVLATARASGGIAVDHDNSGEFLVVRVAAPDRPGLFAQVAGTLVLHRVNIAAADLFTTVDGVALQQFHVLPKPDEPFAAKRLQSDLQAVLAGELNLAERFHARAASGTRHRRAQAASAPRTEVHVTNTASDSTTMVDIRMPDEPSLLFRLARLLTECGLDIRSAKVATLGHEVVDVFYVRERGEQVPAESLEALRSTLLDTVMR